MATYGFFMGYIQEHIHFHDVDQELVSHIKECQECKYLLKIVGEEYKDILSNNPEQLEKVLANVDKLVHIFCTFDEICGEFWDEERFGSVEEYKALCQDHDWQDEHTRILQRIEYRKQVPFPLEVNKKIEQCFHAQKHHTESQRLVIIVNNGKKTIELLSKAAGDAQDIPEEIVIPPTFLDGYKILLKFDRNSRSGVLRLRLEEGPPHIYALLRIKLSYSDGHSELVLGETISDSGIDINENSARYLVGTEVIYKYLFNTEIEHQKHLDNACISDELRKVFKKNNIVLSPNTIVEIKKKNDKWLLIDRDNGQEFSIIKFKKSLQIYKE
jgi:hypothetical protein